MTTQLKGAKDMSKRKGFTLVELIIVIAVIGVLAAILIPVFANVIEKANRKSAHSDARNALTNCIAAITDAGMDGDTDIMFFARKGGKVYVFGYRQGMSLLEYPTAYAEEDINSADDSIDSQADWIVSQLAGESLIVPKTSVGITQEITDEYQSILNPFKTETLSIRTDYQFTSTFIANTESQITVSPAPSASPAGTSAPGNPSNNSPVPETAEPSQSQSPAFNLVFKKGTDDGATNMPADRNIASGAFATIPDDVIPHSSTLTAGATNASAFTHWLGSDGNTYYPGDAFRFTSSGVLELTAQWESGYTVLSSSDDWAQVFTGLSGKYILGCDHATWTSNSAAMFPIGYDNSTMMWTKTFSGVIDGAGYTLSNLTCSYTGSNCPVGLVYSNNGTIRNLNLRITGLYSKGTYLAGVASINGTSGVIRNVDIEYTRSGAYYSASYGDIANLGRSGAFVGAIAGKNSGLISGCFANGIQLRSVDKTTGGIAGENTSTGTIEKCISSACKITMTNSYAEDVGGLVGKNSGNISACRCEGFMTSLSGTATPVGGLVGSHSGGSISNCYIDWSANTIEKTRTGLYFAGVLAGAVSNNAVMEGCVAIGHEGYTDAAFAYDLYGSCTYSASNIRSCYIVGNDSRNLVSVITADDLGAGRAVLSGLDTNVWDFSSGASLPAAN